MTKCRLPILESDISCAFFRPLSYTRLVMLLGDFNCFIASPVMISPTAMPHSAVGKSDWNFCHQHAAHAGFDARMFARSPVELPEAHAKHANWHKQRVICTFTFPRLVESLARRSASLLPCPQPLGRRSSVKTAGLSKNRGGICPCAPPRCQFTLAVRLFHKTSLSSSSACCT